jgi:adenylate kinase family enzyme
MQIPPLDSLGRRIMICGPSNSGKSTLAAAMGRATGLAVVHLDRLRFVSNSDWIERPADDFARDVVAACNDENWIIEGNYFTWIAPRLERATGIVLLGGTPLASYLRYLQRSMLDTARLGRVAGAPEVVNWKMTRWILWDEPRRRRGKIEQLRAAGPRMLELNSMTELNRLYAAWGLAAR